MGAGQDPPHFLKLLTTEKPHTVRAGDVMQNLLKSIERGSKLLTGSEKQRLDKMFTEVIVQEDLPLQVGESDTMHDFLLEVSQGRYKGVSAGTVRVIVTEMSEEGKEQTKIFVARCVEGGTRLILSGDLWSSDGMTLFSIFGHCINEETCAENLPCHQRMPVSNQYAKTSGRTWRIGGSQI